MYIVETDLNPAFPIIKWNGTIIDGYNRYKICKKNDIDFVTIEQYFPSRSAAYIWIIENQLGRRNINDLTKTDLIGRRYLKEKNEIGVYDHTKEKSCQNDNSSKTNKKIADQLGIGTRTVNRAAEFTEALDIIVANTSIQRAAGSYFAFKNILSKATTFSSILIWLIFQ